MDILVPPEIERVLVEEAHRLGTTPELLAVESLRERYAPSVSEEQAREGQETLADFLSGHIGVLHSRELSVDGARMSEDTGKKFATGMLKKRQQGRL